MEKNTIKKESNISHPGVSGKNSHEGAWINPENLQKQHEFLQSRAEDSATDAAMPGFEAAGRGGNLHGRSDLDAQQEKESKKVEGNSDEKLHESIKIALQRSPEADVSKLSLTVSEGIVTIKGSLSGAQETRGVEAIVQNIPGVKKVINQLDTES